jgi:hypothetical protein
MGHPPEGGLTAGKVIEEVGEGLVVSEAEAEVMAIAVIGDGFGP